MVLMVILFLGGVLVIKKKDFLPLVICKCLVGDILYASSLVELTSEQWLERVYFCRQYMIKLDKKYRHSLYYKELVKIFDFVVSYETYTNEEYKQMFTRFYHLISEWLLVLNGEGATIEQ